MRTLNRKLVRELWRLRGQVLAIALVVGSGVAVLVMSLSVIESLHTTTQAYYERYRFADVFANATRVPERVAGRIAAIPGVKFVQTRITGFATLDIEGFAEPIVGQLQSIPESGQPDLNRLALQQGQWIDPDRHDQVILSEPFAEAHHIEIGDRLAAVINGHRRDLQVVGVALSPEFIYALGPGALLPDAERFGNLWMGRKALAAAFDLEESFNDVVVALSRGAQPEPVIERIDLLLEPFGGVSAIARADQLSNWFLMNEIDQISTMVTILPTIFLAVAAFLSYMVLARLIAIERSEIGLLKAFGYSNLRIGWHYAKFVVAVAFVGIVIGCVAGSMTGRHNMQQYADLFRFPLLIYRPSPSAFAIAAIASVAVMLAGALGAMRRAAQLPPAEAMRPPAPPPYRKTRLSSTRLGRWLDQPTRIALRQIARWPGRSFLTCIGIALSVGLLVMALQWRDSIAHIAQLFFYDAQHQTMSVGLAEERATTAVHDFEHLPGVLRAEPTRFVAADFSAGTITHRGSVIGLPHGGVLQPVYDEASGTAVALPPDGILLSTYLAEKLHVDVGDSVWVDVLEGRRPSGEIRVARLFQTTIGMPAYMELGALNRWLGVRPTTQHINLLTDPRGEAALFAELKSTPQASSVALRQAAVDAFHETLGENILAYVLIFTAFAGALGFGVAYNSTRIALSERGRELATLRVLGFTRGEISYILLGEVALLIVVSLPLGCLAGYLITGGMAKAFDTELFRMPLLIEGSSYALGVIIALLATAASAALVRRRVQSLDLIRVLKTRE